VVIIGQDPYHGFGQAHGLCFSVPEGVLKPPSLINIFKELENDLGIKSPLHGNLEKWADQGFYYLMLHLQSGKIRPDHTSAKDGKNLRMLLSGRFQFRKMALFLFYGVILPSLKKNLLTLPVILYSLLPILHRFQQTGASSDVIIFRKSMRS